MGCVKMGSVFRVKYRAFSVITSEVLTLGSKANQANSANSANKTNPANNANKINHTSKTNKAKLNHQFALQLNIKPAQIIKINKKS